MTVNNEKETWLEWADLYSVGALEGEDLAAFETRLASGCEVCLQRLRENQNALAGVFQNAALESPAASVKAKLMAQIEAEAAPVVLAGVSFRFWLVAAGWVLLSLGIVWGWKVTALDRHTREFKRLESAMMTSPQARAVVMQTPKTEHPSANGKMMWNHNGDCLFLTMGLPKISKEKTYEVWGLANGKPVAMGTFEVDEHGCGMLVMKNIKDIVYDTFAVTLEPAGGVPAPTGPMVLVGSL